MRGIAIEVRHENGEAACTRDQSEDQERKNKTKFAAQVGGANIPEFGMQITHYGDTGNLLCTPVPSAIILYAPDKTMTQ